MSASGHYRAGRIDVRQMATGLTLILATQFDTIWSVLFALIAVLFNPVIPIHLNRSTWFYPDLCTAAVFIAHLIFVRQGLSNKPKPKSSASS